MEGGRQAIPAYWYVFLAFFGTLLTYFLDVTELNADPTGQTVGGQLIVDATHTYSDLDELIVNHVQAMARRVEELMAHEKFKAGPEDDLRAKYTIVFVVHS